MKISFEIYCTLYYTPCVCKCRVKTFGAFHRVKQGNYRKPTAGVKLALAVHLTPNCSHPFVLSVSVYDGRTARVHVRHTEMHSYMILYAK